MAVPLEQGRDILHAWLSPDDMSAVARGPVNEAAHIGMQQHVHVPVDGSSYCSYFSCHSMRACMFTSLVPEKLPPHSDSCTVIIQLSASVDLAGMFVTRQIYKS
jgi:hypothetical protein